MFPFFKIQPVTTACQICYEDFKEDGVHTCGNQACDFKMCPNCGRQHLQNSNACPACRQAISNDDLLTFPSLPKERPPCCFRIGPRPDEHDALIHSICLSAAIDNAMKKCNDFAVGACMCLTLTSCVTILPKTIGYYICSGCTKTTFLKVIIGGSRDQCMGEWCAGVGVMSLASILGVSVGKCFRGAL